jgi:hypothetical protein
MSCWYTVPLHPKKNGTVRLIKKSQKRHCQIFNPIKKRKKENQLGTSEYTKWGQIKTRKESPHTKVRKLKVLHSDVCLPA